MPRGQRVRRFEQCLEVVKRLWTEDSVSFENDICKLSNVTATCRPVQRPHPPIWIAANSDAAVRRAARLGDSLFINPHATMPVITGQMALYRAELARHGKPFPAVLPYLREIYCAKDKRTAVEMAGPYLAEKYRTYAQWGQDQVLPGQIRSASRSTRYCATVLSSAAPRNARSSCARAGKRPGRTS